MIANFDTVRKGSLLRIGVDEQADIGADHSRGNHSIQDVSIRGSASVVQNSSVVTL